MLGRCLLPVIVPGPDLSCIKVRFEDPSVSESNVEHMWVNEDFLDGDLIYGTLIDSPNWITSNSEGESVIFTMSEISD